MDLLQETQFAIEFLPVRRQSIEALSDRDLPKRARNALLRGGITTLDDVADWSDRALLSLPHIGHTTVASLRALIAQTTLMR